MVKTEPKNPSNKRTQQRWYVAVLYVDLCRSTELSQRLDAEVYAEVMDELKDFYSRTIASNGGTMLQLHGDGTLAMFGFPAASEEDVRLAVNTALDLHDGIAGVGAKIPELAQIQFPLNLHSGVHAGLVLVQEGDIYAGSFQLRSEVTNICARLSAEADAGEILVDEASLGGSRPYFECSAVREIELKGVEEPVHAVSVFGRSELLTRDQARRKRSRLPFVGRVAEQATLQSCLSEISGGGVQVVGVTGAPGVGKSRLVDEFARGVGEQVLMRASCEPPATARPLQPFAQMLNGLGVEGPFAEEIARFAPFEDAERMFSFFASVMAQRPLVLVIDDWHWIDDGSRHLVQRLSQQPEWPLLIVLSAREIAITDKQLLQPFRHLELDGLSSLEVDQAVKAILPHIDPFIADKIGALCGGNPLFLEELCHSDTVDKLDHAPSRVEHVPQWLYSLVQVRVARLNAIELNIAQTAAVIGRVVPLWLLEQVSDYQADTDLTALSLADLLFPTDTPGEWRFKHGLTREIVYDLVGLRQRQTLHKQIAAAISASGFSQDESLAYHYYGGALYEEAVPFAIAAGDKALQIPALDVAAVQYRLAVDCLDRADVDDARYRRIYALVSKLNQVSMLDPDPEHVATLRRVRDLAQRFDDRQGLATVNYWLGTAHYGLGRPRESLKYHYRARTLAQEVGRKRLVLETDNTIAQATASNCDNRAALALLNKAIAQFDSPSQGTADQLTVSYSLGCKAMVLGDMGYEAAAIAASNTALEMLQGTGHPVEANVRAMWILVRIWFARWQEANAGATELQTLTQKIRNIYLFGMARSLGAYSRWAMNGDAAAADELVEATGWLESHGQGQFMSLNYGWLVQITSRDGDLGLLRRYAARGLWRARLGDHLGEAVIYRVLATTAQQQGWRRPWQAYLARADTSAEARHSDRERSLNAATRELLRSI